MNRDIRDEFLSFFGVFLWRKALRRFSQSKFHFDFEDDSLLLRIKFANANLALNRIASGEVNSPIRDEILI